jgi:hypothetical protein
MSSAVQYPQTGRPPPQQRSSSSHLLPSGLHLLLQCLACCAQCAPASFTSNFQNLQDLGIDSGLARIVQNLPAVRAADVVIVISGMDGSLPSAIAGLVDSPVVRIQHNTNIW